jgi:hypothetical protein
VITGDENFFHFRAIPWPVRETVFPAGWTAKDSGLLFLFSDFHHTPAFVKPTRRTNAMWNPQLTAIRAFGQLYRRHFYIGCAPFVSPGFGCFSLGYRHGADLLSHLRALYLDSVYVSPFPIKVFGQRSSINAQARAVQNVRINRSSRQRTFITCANYFNPLFTPR